MGDARMYWLKAYNFWKPFQQVPSQSLRRCAKHSAARYHINVLPVRFSESTNGLLFRSIFLPIAFTAAAIYAAGAAIRTNFSRRIDIACITSFICAAPLFYHFEWATESPTYWGLVDSFFAGTAAPATALGLYAAVRSSKAAAFVAAAFAAACYAIKPTGLFIVVLVPLVWLVVSVGITVKTKPARQSSSRFGALAVGLLIYGTIVGPIVVIGTFFSDYFNTFNIAVGNRSLVLLREDWLSTSFADLPRYI